MFSFLVFPLFALFTFFLDLFSPATAFNLPWFIRNLHSQTLAFRVIFVYFQNAFSSVVCGLIELIMLQHLSLVITRQWGTMTWDPPSPLKEVSWVWTQLCFGHVWWWTSMLRWFPRMVMPCWDCDMVISGWSFGCLSNSPHASCILHSSS